MGRRGKKVKGTLKEKQILDLLRQGYSVNYVASYCEVSKSEVRTLRRKKKEQEQGGRALLRILGPFVGRFSDKEGRTANYAFVKVRNTGSAQAKRVWAMADVPGVGSFPLHPAGEPYTWEEATAPKMDLLPGIAARWDVAFALPPSSLKQVARGMTSGQVTSLSVSANGKFSTAVSGGGDEKKVWQGQGCWVAYPLALYSPVPCGPGFLRPGIYEVTVTVGCDNDDGEVRLFKLVSGQDWEGLELKAPAEAGET